MPLVGRIHLNRAWLVLASDHTQRVQFGTAGSVGGGGTRNDEYTLGGEFRTYAGGVTRLITNSTQTTVETLTLRALTPADMKMLRSLVGKTVLFRDTYGRRMWCAFLNVQVTDIPLSGSANNDLMTDAAITLNEVTFSEAV